MNTQNIYKKNKLVLLHLSLISGVGPATAFKIIKYLLRQSYPGLSQDLLFEQRELLIRIDFSQIYSYTHADFRQHIGLTNKIASDVYNGLKNTQDLEKEFALIEKYKIDLLTMLDEDYPTLLRQIHLPPMVLYIKGSSLEKEAKRIAFVGARKANDYGRQVTEALVPELVLRDWQIVSGGAIGADTMAHESAINAGGKTIVVLGSGLLQPYPASNKELFRRVMRDGGVVISAFSLNCRPDKSTFPARNRIISGLSQGTVVVQAAARSGALITSEFAMEQGRQVFAIPGSIFDDLSQGCHNLIVQGAKTVTCVEDVLEEFGEGSGRRVETAGSQDRIVEENTHISQMIIKDIDPLVEMLDQAATFDELCSKSGLMLSELQNRLFELQLQGVVKQNFAGAWERV